MGRPSKLTPDQWAAARRRWEGAEKPGFEWLRQEALAAFGDAPSRPAMQQMANEQGWEKGGPPSDPLPPMAKAKAPATANAPAKAPGKPQGKATEKAASKAPKTGPGGALVTVPGQKDRAPAGEKVTDLREPTSEAKQPPPEVADEVVDNEPEGQKRGPGRPSKYRPEFAELIVEYFSKDPFTEVDVDQPSGLVRRQRMPTDPPMLVTFGKTIGVDLTTLNRWATEIDGATGKPRHPDFADAYAHARDLHEALIARASLLSLYDSKTAQFLLKNLHGWQDQPARKVAVAPISKDELEARFGVRMAAARDRMLALLAERRELLVNDPGDDE